MFRNVCQIDSSTFRPDPRTLSGPFLVDDERPLATTAGGGRPGSHAQRRDRYRAMSRALAVVLDRCSR